MPIDCTGPTLPPTPERALRHRQRDEGEWWQLREYAAQRSLHHLKEADPHVWVLPSPS